MDEYGNGTTTNRGTGFAVWNWMVCTWVVSEHITTLFRSKPGTMSHTAFERGGTCRSCLNHSFWVCSNFVGHYTKRGPCKTHWSGFRLVSGRFPGRISRFTQVLMGYSKKMKVSEGKEGFWNFRKKTAIFAACFSHNNHQQTQLTSSIFFKN